MANIKFMVSVDAATGLATMKKVEEGLTGMARETKATSSETNAMDKAFGGLWKQFATGQVVVDAVRAGFRFLKDQVMESVKAAMDAEKTDRALSSALQITGRTIPGLAEDFKDFANEIQRTTTFEDDLVKKSITLLVQTTNLDKKGIKEATKSAMGLATVFGMDLLSATQLMEKAMMGNTGALGRYGIKVAEDLPLEEKRRQLLEQTGDMFKRSQDETSTFGGKLDQLKNNWQNVQEELGKAITQHTKFIDVLNQAANAIVDYLTMDDMLREATDRANEAEGRFITKLMDAATAAGWTTKQMDELIARYQGNAVAAGMAIMKEKEGIEIKEALLAVGKKHAAIIDEQRKAQEKLEKGTVPLLEKKKEEKKELTDLEKLYQDLSIKTIPQMNKEVALLDSVTADLNEKYKKGIIYTEEYERVTKELNDRMMKLGTVVAVQLPKASDKFRKAWEDAIPAVGDYVSEFTWNTKASFEEIALKAYEVSSKVKEYWSQAQSGMNDIFSQAQKNREIEIENEYKKRLDYINATVTNEEEKSRRITALDAEFEIKRTSAKRAAAKQQKAIAIVGAIVNTAEAVTKALAQGGFLLGIPWAAVMAAMGAIQIAMIAKQPIPLAKGGVFTSPTRLMSQGGQTFEMGEGGEPEILAPESKLREIMRAELRSLGGKPSIEVKVMIGDREIKDFIVKTVDHGIRSRKILVPGESLT